MGALVVGRAVSWQELSWGVGGLKQKKKGERGGTETEEREKEGKKQGQYTQRNVVLQTVKLAKLKCTVTMGTLGEKEEKIRLTMNTEKGRDNMYF